VAGRVQGEGSAERCGAIRGFNALPKDGAIPRPICSSSARRRLDRGLWSFNEEIVVRAAATA